MIIDRQEDNGKRNKPIHVTLIDPPANATEYDVEIHTDQLEPLIDQALTEAAQELH